MTLDVRAPVALSVAPGEIVAVVGRNGSGKSSLLRAIAGEGQVAPDAILLDGVALDGVSALRRVAAGIVYVSEERDVFAGLSVDDHLYLFGADADRRGAVFDVFPRLAGLGKQKALTLSGGEQQMLAMARAVIFEPKVLLADEPGAGLSPKAVADVYGAIAAMARRGAAVVVAEQQVARARAVADKVLELGSG